MKTDSPKQQDSKPATGLPTATLPRAALGGTLMGLANLVPGISGGTMLLAAGVFPSFVSAIAEVTRLRFRKSSIVVLTTIVACGGVAILLFAGVLRDLVVHRQWIMYSLFIGLTLGGVPLVLRLARPRTSAFWVAAGVGFAAMAAVSLAQAGTAEAAAGGTGFVRLFVAGLAGASAMILPGVSGGYLLLLLGQYVPILDAIDQFKDALTGLDWGSMWAVGSSRLLPVGLGVIVGVVAVSNGLRYLLDRFRKASLGVLLGLLVGAVVGLWPFRHVDEALGTVQRFDPSWAQGAFGILLLAAGFAVTALVARLGGETAKS